MTTVSRFALLGSLLVGGVLVVTTGTAIAQQANTTFYGCARGDSIKGPINVELEPNCGNNQTLVLKCRCVRGSAVSNLGGVASLW